MKLGDRLRIASSLRGIAGNAGWLVGANGCAALATLALGIVLARALGPRGFGAITLITTITLTAGELTGSRTWETAIKYVTDYLARGERAKATSVVKLCYLVDLVTGTVAGAAVLGLAGIASSVFVKDPSATSLVRIYAPAAILMAPAGTSSALARIAGRFDLVALHALLVPLARLVAVIGIAVSNGGLKEYVLAYLVADGLGAVGSLTLGVFVARRLGLAAWSESPRGVLEGERRVILGFLGFTNLSATSRLITSRADTLLLGALATPAAVGAYRLARVASASLTRLTDPISTAVYPELVRLRSAGRFADIRSMRSSLSVVLAVFVIPGGIVVTVTAPWLVPAIFGSGFESAVPLVQIMVWQLVWIPLLWASGFLLSTGRAKWVAGLSAADAAAYVLLLGALVPLFGATGAAAATTSRFVLWTAAAWWLVRRADRLEEVRR